METKHFIFKIMMYLVVVLFALQPEDYNSFSENEPPFLCIEQMSIIRLKSLTMKLLSHVHFL